MLERISGDDWAGYASPLLRELQVPHVFTTRQWNPEAALDAIGIPRKRTIVAPRQVHGNQVAEARGSDSTTHPEADALVTSDREVLISVCTADCVPVLISRIDGSHVACVHAGWRGLVAGVISAALERVGPGELAAAIGPCLSRARFEVGEEVAARFVEADLESVVVERAGARPHVDLRAAAAIQLERGGVRRLDTCDLCTWEDEADFYSYRRDVTHGGKAHTGRMLALIGVREREDR